MKLKKKTFKKIKPLFFEKKITKQFLNKRRYISNT